MLPSSAKNFKVNSSEFYQEIALRFEVNMFNIHNPQSRKRASHGNSTVLEKLNIFVSLQFPIRLHDILLCGTLVKNILKLVNSEKKLCRSIKT